MSSFSDHHELARNIKVCGSVRSCIYSLQTSANEHNVIYNVTIGHCPSKNTFTYETVKPHGGGGGQQLISIPIQLMWRSSYKEFDNFL